MGAILVLMQVGQNSVWSDRGVPEVVGGLAAGVTGQQAGIEWLYENHPNAAQEHWRLLVWELGEVRYQRNEPQAIITAADYQQAVKGRERPSQPRSRRRSLQIGPSRSSLARILAGEDLLGRTVLITQDPTNNAAGHTRGPWYVAAAPGRDAVAARVHRVMVTERSGRVTVSLGTKVGEIGPLPLGQGVIPVEES